MAMTDPIGKPVILFGKRKTIVGVVKDFHFESLYEKIKPCFITNFQGGSNILIKLKSGTEQATLSKLQNLYKKYNPGVLFDYSFLDANYQALYASEQKVAALSKYFAGMAIITSCLGLFGLAAFTAQRRQREMGIRKVIGASVGQIAFLLSKEFLQLVFTAIAVAFPVAWLLVSKWLNSFAYRIDIGGGLFVMAAVVTIFITLLIIGFQAIKAAVVNPIYSLRND
jgi:putative ABC transport system permease protein